MAEDSNLTRKFVDDDKHERYSCRCHTCSIEFSILEELLSHVSQHHTNADGRVECGECEDLFSSTEDYINHCRTNHDDIIIKSVLALGTAEVEENDSSELPTQITILNDDGETVGLATNLEDENPNLSIIQTTRKRRPSAKFREMIQHEANSKRTKFQQRLTSPTLKNNEIEIDVSDVTYVRLKTSNSNTNNKSNDTNEQILQYLERVEGKLDCILKHFNVPFQPSLNVDSKKYKGTSKYGRASVISNSPAPRTQIVPDAQQELTHYVLSEELLETTFLKSRNRGNFAKNLVYAVFPFDERIGRNCYGRRSGSLCGPKEPLEAAKLYAVREAVFQKYPVLPSEEEESVWKKECVIAIDCALRSEMRHRILAMNGNTDLKPIKAT